MQGFIPPCIPDSHPCRVTSTKCHIDTVISPDDGHTVARNTCRKEKLCTKLALFTRLCRCYEKSCDDHTHHIIIMNFHAKFCFSLLLINHVMSQLWNRTANINNIELTLCKNDSAHLQDMLQ